MELGVDALAWKEKLRRNKGAHATTTGILKLVNILAFNVRIQGCRGSLHPFCQSLPLRLRGALHDQGSLRFPRLIGWGARIRTWECRNQNPVPYHLATPHRGVGPLGGRTIAAPRRPINALLRPRKSSG